MPKRLLLILFAFFLLALEASQASEEPWLAVIVISAPAHVTRRAVLRQTWASPGALPCATVHFAVARDAAPARERDSLLLLDDVRGATAPHM